MLTIESLGIPYSNSIHYKWDASLDKTNGIASSIETSSKKLLLHNDEIIKQTSPSSTSPSSSYKTMLRQRIQDGFCKYPDFLSRKSVSFGLLSSKNIKCFKNNEDDVLQRKTIGKNTMYPTTYSANGCRRSIQISIPFINFSLLEFGKPVTKVHQSRSNSNVIDHTTIQTKIPIIGGLLSCYHDRCQNNDLGHLEFELVSSLCNTSNNSNINEDNGQNVLNIATIQTQIVNYRPKIAGCTAPLNPLREKIYMGLQRPVHAYVMWRFHLHCHSLLE